MALPGIDLDCAVDSMGSRLPMFSAYVAVLLVVLTVAPFTAPFQTIDLATPAGDALLADGSCKEAASRECTIPAPFSVSAPLAYSIVLLRDRGEDIADPFHRSHTVLRL